MTTFWDVSPVAYWSDTNVLQEFAASIFTLKGKFALLFYLESGDSKFDRNIGTSYKTIRHYIPEEVNLDTVVRTFNIAV
jgi:hypothetical protein